MLDATPRSMGRSLLTYAAARDALVAHLREDAAAHAAGEYDAIGRQLDAVERRFPGGAAPELARLHVALTFWDGWVDARNRGWPAGPIAVADWPRLARDVAADLEAERDISAAVVVAHFDAAAHPSLDQRVQTLSARLRER